MAGRLLTIFLQLTLGERSTYIDLGAEKLLAAEKEGQRIALDTNILGFFL